MTNDELLDAIAILGNRATSAHIIGFFGNARGVQRSISDAANERVIECIGGVWRACAEFPAWDEEGYSGPAQPIAERRALIAEGVARQKAKAPRVSMSQEQWEHRQRQSEADRRRAQIEAFAAKKRAQAIAKARTRQG